ncbi:MAG: LapA family protein [Endozoicomonadaceae bacterium]|nr:LapA family protein [Endozoicomonadaceae bacterium]
MKIIRITKIVLYLFIILVFLVFMTSFVAENKSMVNLVLFSHSFPTIPLSAMLVVVFVLGGIIGLFSGTLIIVRLRLHNASIERKLKRREEDLKKLRVTTLKGLS